MEKFVAIDMSRAYLLARYSFEARKVLNDDWLGSERRCRCMAIYESIGNDFNQFFKNLKELTRAELHMTGPENIKDFLNKQDKIWYGASVNALETFRLNLDECWHFAYSGILGEIKLLTR